MLVCDFGGGDRRRRRERSMNFTQCVYVAQSQGLSCRISKSYCVCVFSSEKNEPPPFSVVTPRCNGISIHAFTSAQCSQSGGVRHSGTADWADVSMPNCQYCCAQQMVVDVSVSGVVDEVRAYEDCANTTVVSRFWFTRERVTGHRVRIPLCNWRGQVITRLT